MLLITNITSIFVHFQRQKLKIISKYSTLYIKCVKNIIYNKYKVQFRTSMKHINTDKQIHSSFNSVHCPVWSLQTFAPILSWHLRDSIAATCSWRNFLLRIARSRWLLSWACTALELSFQSCPFCLRGLQNGCSNGHNALFPGWGIWCVVQN